MPGETPRQMTREEIIKQLPDDLESMGSFKGMMLGPPPLEDYTPIKVPERERFFQRIVNGVKQNPVVPLGLMATVFFLGNGLRHMAKRNAYQSQMMMRGRVLAQGFTVLAFLGGLWWQVMKTKKHASSNQTE